MTEYVRSITLLFVLLFLLFFPLERLFSDQQPHRNLRSLSFKVDLVFFLFNPLWQALFAAPVIVWITYSLSNVSFISILRAYVHSWPLPYQVIAVLIFTDFMAYWYHRACHSFPLLWRFHRVHHTSETLDWMATTRQHPVDEVLLQIATNLVAAVIGFSFVSLTWVVLLIKVHTALVHSKVHFRFLLLSKLVVTPHYHHWHHAAETAGHQSNYANFFPFWDLIFKTFRLPNHRPTSYGLNRSKAPPPILSHTASDF